MWSKNVLGLSIKKQFITSRLKLISTSIKCCQDTQLKHAEETSTKQYTDTPRPATVKALKKFKTPFPKSLFTGKCDPEVLEYPEILNLRDIDKINKLAEEIQESVEHETSPDEVEASGVVSALGKISYNLCGSKLPEHYNGRGYTETETAVLNEAIASDANIYKFVNEQQSLSGALLTKYGRQDQKLRFLPSLISGKSVIACAYQERTSLSDDVHHMETFAVPHGEGGFSISGTKMWVYNAYESDHLIVFTLTASKTDTGQRGRAMTAFILPTNTPGITVHPPLSNFSLTGVTASQVDFDNVIVTADSVLGNVAHEADAMVTSSLSDKFDLGPRVVGVGKKLLDQVTNHTINTKYLGTMMCELEGVKARLGRMATALYALESALYLQKGHADLYENADVFLEMCILKVLSSTTLDFLLSESIQLLGSDVLINAEFKNVQKLIKESPYYAALDETNVNLKSAIALNGLQFAGLTLHDEVKQIRNPLMFPSYALKRIFQGRKRYGGNNKGKDLGLAGYLHPTLEEASHVLEYCISRVHLCSEVLLGTYGRLVVDRHIELANLADLAIASYVLVAVLGRASRSYCIGLAESGVEMEMAAAVMRFTQKKADWITERIEEGNVANNTAAYLTISERLLFHKGSFIQRPIARNF